LKEKNIYNNNNNFKEHDSAISFLLQVVSKQLQLLRQIHFLVLSVNLKGLDNWLKSEWVQIIQVMNQKIMIIQVILI
jgi:hypothetical protein